MIFDIKYDSITETNLFLRALWAFLRDGQRMGWQTFGAKDTSKQTILIGHLSSATLNTAKAVSVAYHKRGCMSKLIILECNNNEIGGKDKDFIIDAVRRAQAYKKFLTPQRISTAYSSPYQFRLSPYQSDEIYLGTVSEHALCIARFDILAFDKEDGDYIAKKAIFKIADFLSASCSIPIHVGAKVYEETQHVKTRENSMEIYLTEASDIGSRPIISVADLIDVTIKENINKFCDESWVDEYPKYSACLQLPKSTLTGINQMLSGIHHRPFSQYESATRLYNTACKYEKLSGMSKGYYGLEIIDLDLSPVEIANTLFMSSFEALANVVDDSVETCKTCNQPKYKIRQKVLCLFKTYFGSDVNLKMIDQYYIDRSSYVHMGIHLGDRSYAHVSTPQLDASDRGMASQTSMTNLHIMREVGGELFRRVLKDII